MRASRSAPQRFPRRARRPWRFLGPRPPGVLFASGLLAYGAVALGARALKTRRLLSALGQSGAGASNTSLAVACGLAVLAGGLLVRSRAAHALSLALLLVMTAAGFTRVGPLVRAGLAPGALVSPTQILAWVTFVGFTVAAQVALLGSRAATWIWVR